MPGTPKKYDPEILIARYFSGETTEQEETALRSWLTEDEKHRTLFEQYRKLWEKSGDLDLYRKINTREEWKKLESRLHNNRKTEHTVPLFRKRFFNYAAAVILLLVAGYLAFYQVNHGGRKTFTADSGVMEVRLPDGTAVSLNQGSTLEYNRRFNRKTRIVLLRGMAYFDVARNETKPFIVNTDPIRVTVLGTAFTVDASDPQKEIQVVVDRGKVAMQQTRNKHQVILTPGETGVWHPEGAILEEHAVKDPNYLAWKTGKITFDETPLETCVRTLSKVYHIRINLQDNDIRQCRVTATFDNEPLDTVLEVLSTILQAEITRSDDTYVISGSGCSG